MTKFHDTTRWTVAPVFYCNMSKRMGWEPHVQSVLRGGVAFCTRCGGTAANHAQVTFMDGRVFSILEPKGVSV